MKIINNILNLTFLIFFFLTFLIDLLWYLKILQTLEYFNLKFFRFFKRKFEILNIKNYLIYSSLSLSIINLYIKDFTILFLLKIFLFFLSITIFFVNFKKYRKRKEYYKKELVFTKRLKRIFYLNVFFFLGISILTLIYFSNLIFLILPLYIFLEPFILILLNSIILPVELLINNFYFNDAIKRIKIINPYIIVVTGSYGKTSTKFFINQLLNKKFKSVMTPESFNTAMGVTKFIRNSLKEEDKFFVCELAENEVGGFKRLLKLVKPNILVLTSIGIQHLEEFKNEERILNQFDYLIKFSINYSKCDLIVINGDDENLIKYKNKKIKACSIKKEDDFYAKNIHTDIYGTKFTFCFGNKEYNCQTKILGIENVRNILLASYVAYYLGLSIEDIVNSINNLVPPPHRLNIINRGDILVIDDAYNSNPIGARMAVDLLNSYDKGRKIIVTPGFIELGEKEYEENKKFGCYISNKIDIAILVGGKRSKPIYEGLIESGFKKENIHMFKNFKLFNDNLDRIIKPNDIVLFENDLPEIYEEI